MANFKIFERAIGTTTYEVWLADGLVQFVIGGTIRHDIGSVSAFLAEAARAINLPNNTDASVIESNGSVSVDALENVQGGVLSLDTGGTSPSIALQDDGTEVVIGGGGVGGSFRADFGAGATAQAEAAQFLAFAQDLLGPTTTTTVETLTGIQIGAFQRTVTVATRDDDIREIRFQSTGNVNDRPWADIYVDAVAAGFGGTKLVNGYISETGYTANQPAIEASGTVVRMGFQGVGGNERFSFDTAAEAQDFFDAIKAAFGPGSDRGAIINEAIEIIAESLGGTQIRNGNISTSYEARQIDRTGDGTVVDMGSHGVGGKEQYDFADAATAQKFIDLVRDAVGVRAVEGSLVDEFVFTVSGGGGISGSPRFVGKDDFVTFVAGQFGGERLRDGSVSEGFNGRTAFQGDGSEVRLGPQGVGGTEVWDFGDVATAQAFAATLGDVFG